MTTRLSMTHHSRGRLNGNLLLKFPALYDNKYVIFYSLWPCYFIPSLNLVAYVELLVNKPSIRMYILMLDTRNVEQKKYVLCTLRIFIVVDVVIAVHGTGLK